MQKKFKVKLLTGHSAHADQIIDGYLGNSFHNGRIQEYTRGEAIKKAKMFGGKIEEIIPERLGAAQICVIVKDNKIIVRHTTERGQILFEKDAVKGDWDRIWDAIKKSN